MSENYISFSCYDYDYDDGDVSVFKFELSANQANILFQSKLNQQVVPCLL